MNEPPELLPMHHEFHIAFQLFAPSTDLFQFSVSRFLSLRPVGMAEVIGVVSGALTFATVAAQVTKSIIEIRDCWGQIRDAPEDLQRLVKEIEIFGFILADIEADLSQDSVAGALKNSNHASQSLELCKHAASDIEAVSRGLKDDINNTKGFKKSYASFKVVIKKGKIEKYRTRLGSATRLLSLSQQCYTRSVWNHLI